LTPQCAACTEEWETPDHLALRCPATVTARTQLYSRLGRPLRTRHDLALATEAPESAGILVRWFLTLGRLPEYRVAAAEAWATSQAESAAGGPDEGYSSEESPDESSSEDSEEAPERDLGYEEAPDGYMPGLETIMEESAEEGTGDS
jgi:hypothetical protein